jgi:hypothetical protein
MITNRSMQASIFVALVFGGTFFLSGCESKGPAEQAGEQIDKGIQNAKDAVNPPGPLEKAGRAIGKAGGN